MRTLVHNYSSEISTEAIYIAQFLREEGNEVKFWNNQESAFDVFDDFKPDVFFTHYLMLTKDIAKRTKGEGVKTVINVTGATPQHLQVIDDMMENHYCFQNYKMLPDIDVVAPCADFYLKDTPGLKVPRYAIETLFIVDSQQELDLVSPLFEDRETYHVLTNSIDMKASNQVDEYVSIAVLSKLYQNYEEIIVTKSNQVFFDAAYYGGKCGLIQREGNPVFLQKEVVESGHSPYNRVTALLEKIGENGPYGEKDARYIGNSGDERV